MSRKGKVIAAAAAAAAAAAVGGAAAVAGGIALTRREMRSEFKRGEYPEREYSMAKRFDPDFTGTHTRVNVQFKSGENTLQGYIYGMENESPKGLIVFAHGISAGHESYICDLMWFVDNGWRLFSYDATGSCTSEGDSTVGLVQSALDLDKALTYAESDRRLNGLPVYLLGHSWGGYAVCAVQCFDHKITAAVSLSGYADPLEMINAASERSYSKAARRVLAPFIKDYNKRAFGEYSDLRAVDSLNGSGVPTLVVHGEEDTLVDFNRVSIYSKQDEITDPRVEFVKLTGKYADHVGIFKSERANEYSEEYYKARRELEDRYVSEEERKGGSYMDRLDLGNRFFARVPAEEREEFMSKWDKELINEINLDLVKMIEEFYLKNSDGTE